MRALATLCLCLAMLFLPQTHLVLADAAGESLVFIENAGEAAATLDAFGLSPNCELSDGYLAFLGDADLSRLPGTGLAYRILDADPAADREYLVIHSGGPVDRNGIPNCDPAAVVELRVGATYRVVSAPSAAVENAGTYPDLQRVFRRSLRAVRTPWTRKTAAGRRDADQVISDMLALIDATELEADVQTLQDFGTRHSSYNGGLLASQWIRDEFLSFGYTDVTFHDFDSHNDNVVCVKPGSVYADRYVVIGGHYDSTSYDNSYAPGADDNATGTVGVLTAARLMAGHDFEYTLIFIAFSGEEQGLIGSDAWASEAADAGMDIIGMINLDMLCYLESGDASDLDVIFNGASAPLRDLLYDVVDLYVPGHTVVDGYLSGGSSDHASFWGAGYRSIFLFEDSGDYSPYIHTPNDVIGTSANDFDFMVKNVRAAVAVTAALAAPFHVSIAHDALEHSTGTGPFTVDAVIRSAEALDAGSLELRYRVNGGGFAALPLTPGAGDAYSAAIPAQAAGNLVEYYLSASDIAGYTATHPDGAPAALHAFRVGITEIFAEDGESDQGWTLGVAGDDATTGVWIRDDPVGTEYQPEDDHSDPGTLCFVTGNAAAGSSAGTNDVDGGRTTLLSPVFDLADAAWAGLSYWRWYTDETSHDDDFHVDISSDGGESWRTLEIVTDSAYPWVQAVFDDLGASYTLTDRMRLRFIAEDTGDGSLVEALIDDLRVVAVAGDLTAVEDTPAFTSGLTSWPNPFNPTTTLGYQLPSQGWAELTIHDARGAVVATPLARVVEAGAGEIVWDASDLPSGVYMARLSLDGETLENTKITLLK